MYLFSNFQYKLTVPKHGQVLDLCKSLGVKTGIAPEDVSEIFYIKCSIFNVSNHKQILNIRYITMFLTCLIN